MIRSRFEQFAGAERQGHPPLSNTTVRSLSPRDNAIGTAFVLFSAVGVVFLPTSAKIAYLDGSNVNTVAFARGIIAVVLLAFVAMVVRQRFRLPRELLRPSLVSGVAQALFVYGVYSAITSINISLALLILYLYPIVLALYQHLEGSSRLRGPQWLCAAVCVAGLALILGVQIDQISPGGVAFALMSMLATVVITLTNYRVTSHLGSLVSNFYMSLWSLVIFLVVLLVAGNFAEPRSLVGWSALAGNGLAYCVAWVAFFAGARILGATRASMLSLVEPPGAALGAWLLFGETYTSLQWFGFAVVLAALFGFEYLSREKA